MEFKAVLQKHEGIDAAFIEIPFNIEKEFGQKRVKVTATFDGVPYRGSILTMQGHTFIGVTREIRARISKNAGEEVAVTIEKDEAPRTVEIPDDLKEGLSRDVDAAGFFGTLSYTNQKNFIHWIVSSKTQLTREKRIQETLSMLSRGILRK